MNGLLECLPAARRQSGVAGTWQDWRTVPGAVPRERLPPWPAIEDVQWLRTRQSLALCKVRLERDANPGAAIERHGGDYLVLRVGRQETWG